MIVYVGAAGIMYLVSVLVISDLNHVVFSEAIRSLCSISISSTKKVTLSFWDFIHNATVGHLMRMLMVMEAVG